MALRARIRPAFGARPLKRVIQRDVLDRLARLVLGGELRDGETVTIDADGNDLHVHDRTELRPRSGCDAYSYQAISYQLWALRRRCRLVND